MSGQKLEQLVKPDRIRPGPRGSPSHPRWALGPKASVSGLGLIQVGHPKWMAIVAQRGNKRGAGVEGLKPYPFHALNLRSEERESSAKNLAADGMAATSGSAACSPARGRCRPRKPAGHDALGVKRQRCPTTTSTTFLLRQP
jgi:hypothetical protein